MLFNSYPFILLFLPLTLGGFFVLGAFSRVYAALWLALASLFFYGWWNPAYVGLLLASILFNFVCGSYLARTDARSHRRALLIFAVGANLLLLAYYKYANFFVASINAASGAQFTLGNIILPLGISFFTFTQIAFLVDTARGQVREFNLIHYMLFVTYFPHLIAGPVLHHKEMMPQFSRPATYKISTANIAVGLTIFFFGLFKKVVFADGIATYVGPAFAAAHPTFLEAWCGALAYTLQLYFDFSGYSDMAIGLSRLFGVTLPLNFFSPYKAVNIIEFWRRWHMTLSRFLRDYLYIPLGGNRHGIARRHANLMLTMLLGGLWHGAGWTFVLWGGLHGAFLVINHVWRAFRKKPGHATSGGRAGALAGGALTFAVVVMAWVCFRADSVHTALAMIKGMLGGNGLVLPLGWQPLFARWSDLLAAHGVQFGATPAFAGSAVLIWIAALLAVVWLAPNTAQIMAKFEPALDMPVNPAKAVIPLQWRPNLLWAITTAIVSLIALLHITRVSEFLYFRF